MLSTYLLRGGARRPFSISLTIEADKPTVAASRRWLTKALSRNLKSSAPKVMDALPGGMGAGCLCLMALAKCDRQNHQQKHEWSMKKSTAISGRKRPW